MGTKYRERDKWGVEVEWELAPGHSRPAPTWAAFKQAQKDLATEQHQTRPTQDGSAPAHDEPASPEAPRADG